MIRFLPFLVLALLPLSACQPAPRPSPQPTAVPLTETPRPIPATLTAAPTRTPSPAPTHTPTVTPEPYPLETRESFASGEMQPEPIPGPRLGVAAALGKGLTPCDGREWQMAWSSAYYLKPANCPGVEHIPMLVWSPQFWEPLRAANTANKRPGGYWLIFNECESQYQCATTPETAARFYHDVILPWVAVHDPAAKLIVGGVNAGECGIDWLEQFVTFYRVTYGEDVPRAGWQAHAYGDIWAGELCDQPWQWSWSRTLNTDAILNAWLDQADSLKRFVLQYGRPGDEIWISETSCLAPPPAACRTSTAALANMVIEWLNSDGRWVTRVAWYADWDSSYWKYVHLYTAPPGEDGAAGQLSPVGEIWLNAELLPAQAMTFHYWYSPMALYSGLTPTPSPAPQPTPGATPTAPGYPGPGDLHP